MIPANPNAVTGEDMHKLFGRCILFIGVEAQHWTIGTFTAAAKWAHSMGIDTISPKRADGSIKWYNDAAQLRRERDAVLAEGVGYAPFAYCYGPRFGDRQIHDECAVLQEMGDANQGCVIADMEYEWDGQTGAAVIFNELMRPWKGVLGVTTWADLPQQDWLSVAAALAPCVNLWIPQQYDNWLAAQNLPPEITIVQAGVDMSTEFGPNNVTGIVARMAAKNESAWIWDYYYAERNPGLMRQLVAELHREALAELPEIAPDAGYHAAYMTQNGDTLETIAAKLGLSNPFQDVYKPNQEAIEAAARAAGHPGSSGGLVIVPGVKLNYNG